MAGLISPGRQQTPVRRMIGVICYGDYSSEEFERLLHQAVYSYILKSEPDISTIIDKKKILKDFIIERPLHNHAKSAFSECMKNQNNIYVNA